MKKLVLLLLSLAMLAGCTANQTTTEPTVEPTEETVVVEGITLTDGIYRGAFTDSKQVEVEFEIKDNKFETFKYRALSYKGDDYLNTEDATLKGITAQYQALADYLVGKDVSAVYDLYAPENIAEDTDVFTAATMRSSKLISAINDAAKRGVYKMTENTANNYGTYADGTYRGAFTDPAQVELEIVLNGNTFETIKFRSLSYKGDDYLKTEDATLKGITAQYQALADYLIGKEVSELDALYAPENIAEDTDVFTAATLRSSKFISAVNDALARGVYKMSETSAIDYNKEYDNGTYRGAFTDPKQVEVELVLNNNTIESIKFRSLSYKGDDYLKTEDATLLGITEQYQALADYLTGKELSAIVDLYAPENIAQDTDVFTAATVRSSKMISAINDALARGAYKLAK